MMYKTNKILLVLLTSFLIISGCKDKRPDTESLTYNNKRIRDTFIGYMSQPMFRNSDFVQQVTGTEADLKLYDLDERTLYFVINKSDFDSGSTLQKITIEPASAEFGFEQNGKVFLGAYTLKGTDRFLFRIPAGDLKADTSAVIKKRLGEVEYDITAFELADFSENNSIYGGMTDAETVNDKYIANHGAFVSKGIEPSLRRLCDKISKGEARVEILSQKLLDFVTHNIQFDRDEAAGGYEIMKRPNEVLLSGGADCSGMTILFASLLEQYGINYRLIYFEGHIAAGIEGDFPGENGLTVNIDGTTFHMAETTARGFVIGRTKLLKSDIAPVVRFTQKPGRDSIFVKYPN